MLIYIFNLYSLLFIYVFSYLYNIKYQSHKRSYLQQRGRCLLYLRSCSQHKIASFTRHSSACWLGSIFIRTEDFCSILILAGSLSRLQLQNQEAWSLSPDPKDRAYGAGCQPSGGSKLRAINSHNISTRRSHDDRHGRCNLQQHWLLQQQVYNSSDVMYAGRVLSVL